jgi:redox-sensitive bicupin YhaK (pirin superfamily)
MDSSLWRTTSLAFTVTSLSLVGTLLAALDECSGDAESSSCKAAPSKAQVNGNLIKEMFRLQTPWKTFEPFLFCVHHHDRYPAGTPGMEIPTHLRSGREIGSDFSGKDGWSMYHGSTVPGFPAHPHRGFETVTVTRKGLVDHFDSAGGKGRYGFGDTQWMTAGKGVQHCEMFPLVNQSGSNEVELFQIWLNLPRAKKAATPTYTMLWAETTPTKLFDEGRARVRFIAGMDRYFPELVGAAEVAPANPSGPPPDSYGASDKSDLLIWEITLTCGGRFTIPKAKSAGVNRALYLFRGAGVDLFEAGKELRVGFGVSVSGSSDLTIVAKECTDGTKQGPDQELLLLQGQPLGEPVAQHGPFVMNTREEIQVAFRDYQATQFGGWPWPRDDPVNPPTGRRFAVFPGGRMERPPTEEKL